MVSALHRALELNEIELLLQPIVDLGDGRLAGVEALLRWRRAGELVPPLEFVPLAEEAGPDRRDRALRAGRGLPARPAARGAARRAGRRSASTSRRGTRCRAISRRSVEHALRQHAGSIPRACSSSSPRASASRTSRASRTCSQRCASSGSRSRWTTSAPAGRRSGCCAACRSTRSRSTAASPPACRPAAAIARSSHPSSRSRAASACRPWPRASSGPSSTRGCARSAATSGRATCSRGRAPSSSSPAWLAQRAEVVPLDAQSSAQSCLTFSQSASAGLRLGGRKRQPGKACAGGVNAPRSTSRSMLPR